MDLFLVRHAEAEPAASGGGDARRALTARGKKQFTRSVRGLDRLGFRLDHIVHSPLLRAVETAEILAGILDGDGQSVVCARLAEPPSEELLASLEGERVALVGHEPWMSDLCTWLVTGWRFYDGDSNPTPIEFKKGAVAWLSGEPRPGRMTLEAHLPPRVLRKLGRK